MSILQTCFRIYRRYHNNIHAVFSLVLMVILSAYFMYAVMMLSRYPIFTIERSPSTVEQIIQLEKLKDEIRKEMRKLEALANKTWT